MRKELWRQVKGRTIVLALGVPALVAGYMLVGALVFQLLLYLWYGQPIFDNVNLPGEDYVFFHDRSAAIRWPAQLVARAGHMWMVQWRSAVTVLVGGTMATWAWMIFRGRRGAGR